MGRSKCTTAVALALCATLAVMLPELVAGKRYIVGGNMGWTTNYNYTLWAANQTFYRGDWLYLSYLL
ncbi:putative Phytocyanin domain, cupredoxin [Helianthus annuus]|nr:putative Phytocyanin domain, cupredoxin [Helianthus annuus]